MYLCFSLLAPDVNPVDPTEAEVTFLWVLGAVLILIAVAFLFLPSRLIEKVPQYTEVEWGTERKLHVAYVQLVFLGGLACVGASVYVSEPYRLAKASSPQLIGLTKENSNLRGELNEARRQADIARRVTVRLKLTAPPELDLNQLHLTDVRCHYRLSDGHDLSTEVGNGMGPQDLGCVIENISPDVVILRINIEQEIKAPGQPTTYRMLAYRENIYPAQPNYDLCAPNRAPCR